MSTSASLLPSSLRSSLGQIISQANASGASIRAILLSTTEGVPLGRAYASDEPMNEDVLASMESIWAPLAKQFPIIGLDKVHQVTAMYDHGTCMHVYQGPLVITILCGGSCNLGSVRSTAIPLLKVVLEPLVTTLMNSLKPDWSEDEGVYPGVVPPAYYQ